MPNNRSHIQGHGWIEGKGAPSSAIGHKDQYYRDLDTGEVYQKKSAVLWEAAGDLTNYNLLWGNVIPTAIIGKKGDSYINYVSLIMYEKTSDTAWTPRCKVAAL